MHRKTSYLHSSFQVWAGPAGLHCKTQRLQPLSIRTLSIWGWSLSGIHMLQLIKYLRMVLLGKADQNQAYIMQMLKVAGVLPAWKMLKQLNSFFRVLPYFRSW